MNNKNKPLVSIVIPLYNKSKVVEKTISSVLNQSFYKFELIIVDDGSTDNSLELVSKISDERIVVFKKKNGGVSEARNFGVKKAKSDWIFLLDADDVLYENALQILFNLVQKYPDKSIYVANFCVSTNRNLKLYCKERVEGVYKNTSKNIWSNRIFTRTGNTLINKAVFESVGYFREDMSYYEDMEFILRYSRKYEFVYTPVPVFKYETDNNDLSNNSRLLTKEFAYYALFTEYSFYAKLIVGRIIYFSIKDRIKRKEKKEVYYLVKKYYKNLFIIIFSVLFSKIMGVDN